MPLEAGKPAAVCSGGGEEYGMLLPHPPVPTLPHGQVPPLGRFKWWQVRWRLVGLVAQWH